jgi:hypothetical protein
MLRLERIGGRTALWMAVIAVVALLGLAVGFWR